jgi:hypothetical protein
MGLIDIADFLKDRINGQKTVPDSRDQLAALAAMLRESR